MPLRLVSPCASIVQLVNFMVILVLQVRVIVLPAVVENILPLLDRVFVRIARKARIKAQRDNRRV